MSQIPELRQNRRGSALILVLVLVVAISTLAVTAIFLSSNASILSKQYDREREFRYASEAALQIAKSNLNNSAYALPDTGYRQMMSNASILGADNLPLPGVQVNLYVGKTGSTSGQFGRFASVVSEARDNSGARYVRRLELAQESFARFAYWSDTENNGNGIIYFANGDNLFGPVWSNDNISIHSSRARFFSDVGTAKTISGKQNGTFDKGYQENLRPIPMPGNAALSKLQAYAAAGNFAFNAPTTGGPTAVRMRIEFVALDLPDDPDTDSTGTGEGFFRVYNANPGQSAWLRGDFRPENCGDWHRVTPAGALKFFPAAVHNTGSGYDWVGVQLRAGTPGMTSAQADAERGKSFDQVMRAAGARCFMGGDPHLAAVERLGQGSVASYWQVGGDPTTFTPVGNFGAWNVWPGTIPPSLNATGRSDAAHLFPLFRGHNTGTQGVIHVVGTVGLSGVLRGSVTLHATGDVIYLDDLRYANDPGLGRCRDMLGVIAARNAIVSDNAVNKPQIVNAVYKPLDDTPDLFLQNVIMALNQSFQVEGYNQAPSAGLLCGGQGVGRGCLYLTGGVIQKARGPVGTTGGTGYVKRYSYDRCVLSNPPPFFPTTGRFIDNRYYEIDPVNFTVAGLFARLNTIP